MSAPLRIGTRGSQLALWQANEVARRLGRPAEVIPIRTTGDKRTDVTLASVGGKGVFIKELEEALSPLTEAVYSQAKPSIDIKGIIDRSEFLLIDLKETDYFSSEEKVVLAAQGCPTQAISIWRDGEQLA